MSDIFSPEALRKAAHDSLDSALAAIPDGKRGALLVVADKDGARVLVAAKLGANWQIEAGVGKPWDGPIGGQVAIAGSW